MWWCTKIDKYEVCIVALFVWLMIYFVQCFTRLPSIQLTVCRWLWTRKIWSHCRGRKRRWWRSHTQARHKHFPEIKTMSQPHLTICINIESGNYDFGLGFPCHISFHRISTFFYLPFSSHWPTTWSNFLQEIREGEFFGTPVYIWLRQAKEQIHMLFRTSLDQLNT